MRRRLIPLSLLALIVSPILLAIYFIRIPLLVLEPGPAPDIAGRSKIEAPTFASRGSFHLTTAQVRSPSGSTVFEVVGGLIDPDKRVLPREAVYPRDRSNKETESVQAAQMVQSELAAATAALNELGMPSQPDGVFVNEVDPKVPAAKLMRAGDVISGLNSAPVNTVEELTAALKGFEVGAIANVSVRRGTEDKKLLVKTVGSSAKKGQAELGVQVSQSRRAPIKVTISAKDIGGPSAGLMFALSIYDRLVPEDLTGGVKVAGTGTIENSPGNIGKVGEVGAVDLKVRAAEKIGAKVFMVPESEAAAAKAAAGPGLRVLGVSTLSEAITALRKLEKAA